ncbi:MAG: hypothetical protein JO249_00005 [Acidobacteria bacterium]|nr:hypothetical protein [Acidobacteriota bacterium]
MGSLIWADGFKPGLRLRLGSIAYLLMLSVISPAAVNNQKPAATPGQPVSAGAPFRNQPIRLAKRATAFYQSVWGIDSLVVKWAESGELVRFSYRVTDPQKAKPLNDKKVEPVLLDGQAGVKLVVPMMEKVGALRQSSTPEAGKSYWMAFSNSGRRVKRGDHVDVVIGNFRAQGLTVD